MRKILIHRPGGYEQLRLETVPDPVPGPGEILLDVQAAGVNYADCVIRMGLYASAKKYVGYPITPGFDIAGTVAALGEGVDGPPPGTPMAAVTRFGGYATRCVIPAGQVFRLPGDLSPEQAAALPTVFLTAWYAWHKLARPHPGSTVLIHSAAGGVGGTLVQLAVNAGCRTIGAVGSAHKVEYVQSLGATSVIDASSESLWLAVERAAPEGCDVVFDANGVRTLKESYRHLRPTGRLVIYGFHTMLPRAGHRVNPLTLAVRYLQTPRFSPFKLTGDNKSVMGFNLSYLFDRADLLAEGLEALAKAIETGILQPPPIATFPLANAAEAHRAIESGQTIGKLVLLT